MIRRDKNHPSLIIWSMANESRTETETGASVMRTLIRRTRELDSTRLVTFVIGGGDTTHHAAYEEADLRCVNVYLGQFGQNTAAHFDEMDAKVTQPSEAYLRRQLELAPGKPILVTEFAPGPSAASTAMPALHRGVSGPLHRSSLEGHPQLPRGLRRGALVLGRLLPPPRVYPIRGLRPLRRRQPRPPAESRPSSVVKMYNAR